MKFPLTALDVKNEILLSSNNKLRIRQLIHILQNVDSEIIVEGIIQVFEIEESYENQFVACEILNTLKPKSKKELKEVLLRTSKNWNKSVNHLPFWFLENYGLETVMQTFKEFDDNEKINTMKWWLNIKKNI